MRRARELRRWHAGVRTVRDWSWAWPRRPSAGVTISPRTWP